MFDAVNIKNDCIKWIRDWFESNGTDCTAVVGISGGADSSVVAALCVEALGADRVLGVLMPNGTQADINDSRELVEHLGIDSITIDIHNAFVDIRARVTDALGGNWSNQSNINLPPRIRMATLYAVAQTLPYGGRVANTCNLSEDWVGFSTVFGDGAGDFSPLGNLTKTEVVAIGDALGLPYKLVHKTPSDGLTGKTDEDNFGFTYKVLDEYIEKGTCEYKEIKEKIDRMHKVSRFKMKFRPPTFDPDFGF